MRAIICLEDGFYTTGVYAGPPKEVSGEIAFHTGTAYDDALTDPAYAQKILVFAFPMIGTYNLPDDALRGAVEPRGLVARDVWPGYSGDGGTPLLTRLAEEAVPVLTGVDTRGLVRHLTKSARLRAIIAPLDDTGDSWDSGNLESRHRIETLVKKACEEMTSCPKINR